MLRGTMMFILACFLTAGTVSGQPAALSVNNAWVAPGEAVRITVTAAPNSGFAIVASTSGTGGAIAGVPLDVGGDYVVIASGALDASGRAVLSYTPPFSADGPARLYLQAGSSRSTTRFELSLSSGLVLTNRVAQERMVTPLSVLHLQDSDSPPKRLGVALGSGWSYGNAWFVLIPYERWFIRVQVTESGPVPTPWFERVAWFEGEGCSGRPFAQWGNGWGGEATVIGTMLYVPLGAPSTVTIKSSLRGDELCEAVGTLQLQNARPVGRIAFPRFTPPLKLVIPAP
jgi:hypothetical protein